MELHLFLISLAVAILAPMLAITYLRPILVTVLRGLCDAAGGAEFWVRSAYLLAVCGTVLLTLVFGRFDDGTSTVDTLRRALLLAMGGVFVSVTFITRSVWGQVRELLRLRAGPVAAPAAREVAATWPGDTAGATPERAS